MNITNCGTGVHAREIKGIDKLRKLPKHWYAFTNLDIIIGAGRSREIDIIIVTPERILLVDIKDWHGNIVSSSGNWLQNGIDRGQSPVNKVSYNARELSILFSAHLKKHANNLPSPYFQGIVAFTGSANYTGVSGPEQKSVFKIDNLIKILNSDQLRRDTFGNINPYFVSNLLTDNAWKDRISKFFNARTGNILPGKKRYGQFKADSEFPSYSHTNGVYSEYTASDELSPQILGTLRLWDFTKAETRFQTEEGRAEITGREREVVEYLCDRSDDADNVLLKPYASDPERGVGYWEVFERRRRLKRLSEFKHSDGKDLSNSDRIEISRQILTRVGTLHSASVSHLDLGEHSVWLEASSSVKLSHLMAAQIPQIRSLGASRYQFLSSAKLPEIIFSTDVNNASDPKRKDVFLLGGIVHIIIFGTPPTCSASDMPPEWSDSIDTDAKFTFLYEWFNKALSLLPEERFADANEALDYFNKSIPSISSEKETLEGLETFRKTIKTQMNLFRKFPVGDMVRESDELDIWTSQFNGSPCIVKLWKSSSWGDNHSEKSRILSFLDRANELSLSPISGCAEIHEVFWLNDSFAVVQQFIPGLTLKEFLSAGHFKDIPEENLIRFMCRLVDTVVSMHEVGMAHGDVKPDNIIVGEDNDPTPYLIDLVDFTAESDGEIQNFAYSPPEGGRFERDRYAISLIIEEILEGTSDFLQKEKIHKAAKFCRDTMPSNGTLLPLLEALYAKPEVSNEPQKFAISALGMSTDPFDADEGKYYLRRMKGKDSLVIRGATEVIEFQIIDKASPVSAKRYTVNQSWISRNMKHELPTPLEGIFSVISSNLNDFSSITELLTKSPSASEWAAHDNTSIEDDQEGEITSEDDQVFDDIVLDELGDKSTDSTSQLIPVDIRTLWRRLVDVERDLTTEGVAEGNSVFKRDIDRHIIPFEFSNGVLDFNRGDSVGVQRLGKKDKWQRIGRLDIERSRPDRIYVEPEYSSQQSDYIKENERLRFISHFELQSLNRRDSAVSRILSGQARAPKLIDVFDPSAKINPISANHTLNLDALDKYNLNSTQQEAFQTLIQSRPVGLVQGPPGTGKTVFIAALAHYALTNGLAKNILLASQSHEAVNNAAEALLKLFANEDKHPSILRVGNEAVVSDRLLPFHTDRVEQLYKDKFRAELRDRLRVGGSALNLPPELVEDLIFVETTINPICRRIFQLSQDEQSVERVKSLIDTLCVHLDYLNVSPKDIWDQQYLPDPEIFLANLILILSRRDSANYKVSPDNISKFFALSKIATDYINSVSTSRRGFETFLAGTRQIVAGTCVGLGRPSLGLTTTPFDLVIVDEAARCTASELSVPMQAGRWIVLVGDQAQLQPQHDLSVLSKVSREISVPEDEIVRSDFERAFTTNYGSQAGKTLTLQYRMLPPIGQLVSNTFYDGALQHGRTKPVIDLNVLPDELSSPLVWVSTDALGDKAWEEKEPSGTSRHNSVEAEVIVELLKKWSLNVHFIKWIVEQNKHSHAIGVICMYAAQRDKIRRLIQEANLPEKLRKSIKIDTVDSYQGKENPIVIVSLVRNNANGPIQSGAASIAAGFLKQENRINVAASRAMDRLVFVGAYSRWPYNTAMSKLVHNFNDANQHSENKIISALDILSAEMQHSKLFEKSKMENA